MQAPEPLEIWAAISCSQTMRELRVERALIRGLGANCRQPVACELGWEAQSVAVKLLAWGPKGGCLQSQGRLALDTSTAELVRQAEALATDLKARLPADWMRE